MPPTSPTTVQTPNATPLPPHGSKTSLSRRLRLPAIACALAVLACELISRPYANMGISDDLAYLVSAHTLATTGQLHYVGAAAAMLAAQLYIGAALIKLFGFSFTTVRMGTLLVAIASAFLLQRSMVRANISERNATIGTLALVISPLYLILSVTYMSDIYGVFAMVICFYCCLRALQSASSHATVSWLFAAVVTNAVFGTARQVAWLGILVMVPCTLWLLRHNRRAVLAGAIFTVMGAVFVFDCMIWYQRQPYSLPAPLGGNHFPMAHAIGQLIHTFLDIPFLLLPLFALFIPQIRRGSKPLLAVIAAFSIGYLLLALHWRVSHPDFLLEPTQGALGGWIGIHGVHEGMHLQGTPPLFLPPAAQILLTILSIAGILGLIAALLRSRALPTHEHSSNPLSWKQLAVLLCPYSIAYTILLLPSATNLLFDRYTLELLVILTLCLIRFYQDRICAHVPNAAFLLIALMAVLGVAITHNNFALYRARVLLAQEIRSRGLEDTDVDNGWEYNFNVELQHANHINDPGILFPANTYLPPHARPTGLCDSFFLNKTPHIRPIYATSFDPNACYGPAPFAPVHYSRWLASSPGTLYVVKYLPPDSPQYRR
jgi:hypothetical protein